MHGRSDPGTPHAAFLAGGGEMGALMRAHDWTSTPLGAPETWPRALKIAVRLLLNTGHPMYIWWGPDLLCFYNDAYRRTLGPERHPGSLGRPGREVWAEIWHLIGPQVDVVMAARGSTWDENRPVPITRFGRLDEIYWTYSYSPIDDEATPNGVGGVLVVCTETTQSVLAERRRGAEAERQRRLFEQAPGFIAILTGPEHIFEFVNESYNRLFDRRGFVGRTVRDALPELQGQGFYELLDGVYATGERFVANAMPIRLRAKPEAEPTDRFLDFIYEPMRDDAGAITGIFVEGYDVTERVIAEAALRESETRFRNMADKAPVMMWVTDPSGFCTYLNARWYEFTGQVPGGGEGYGWLDAVHPTDRPLAEQAFVSANAEQRDYRVDFRLRRADGAYRWTIDTAAARFAENGEYLGYVGSVIDIDERREAEEKLSLSEEQLRLALEVAEIGQWDVDHLTGTMFWPPRVKAMFGISPDVPVTLADFHDNVHPDDREKTRAAYEAASDPIRRPLYDVEYRTIGKEDGVVRWVAAKGRGIFDSTGRCVRVIGTAIDVTARKAAEAALIESQERYRTLFESIESGFCVVEVDLSIRSDRVDYRVVEANPAFYRQTGFPKHILGCWLREAAPDLEEYWYETYGRVARTGQPERLEQGSEMLGRWFDVYAFRIGEPDEHRVAILFNDISARRAAEERLRELNETLESQVAERTADRDRMWRLSTDLMLVARFDATITAVNPAWTSLLGWSESELIGRRFIDLVHPDDVAATLAEAGQLADGRTTLRFENRYQERSGSYRHLAWTAVPGDNLIHAVARDVTEERERQAALETAQDQLRQAQKMEAVGQLTGGVAHDFNNLLTIIKSSTDLLRRPDIPEERRRRYVDAISDTVDRASKLTGQLLAFARRQALKPEVFDAAERIRSVADMLRTIVGSRIRIETDIACEACFVEADASQFETALINMAVNARDAMDGEGTLTIRVEGLAAMPPLRGHGGSPGQFVALSLSDTGVGIPADKLTQIFEPFYTTKEVGKGTGLGLSQLFGFAKQSGGDVQVESEVGQGTTFTLYLPRTDATGANDSVAPHHGAEPAEHGRGRRILVVEDNVEVGRFSTQLLQDLGYETTWAANADEALTLIAEVNGFDAVFSDVVMPGMSGVELGHEIRRRYPKIPVVLTSGYSHVLAQEGSHGFELLHKPYAVEDLSRVLRRVTRSPIPFKPGGEA